MGITGFIHGKEQVKTWNMKLRPCELASPMLRELENAPQAN